MTAERARRVRSPRTPVPFPPVKLAPVVALTILIVLLALMAVLVLQHARVPASYGHQPCLGRISSFSVRSSINTTNTSSSVVEGYGSVNRLGCEAKIGGFVACLGLSSSVGVEEKMSRSRPVQV